MKLNCDQLIFIEENTAFFIRQEHRFWGEIFYRNNSNYRKNYTLSQGKVFSGIIYTIWAMFRHRSDFKENMRKIHDFAPTSHWSSIALPPLHDEYHITTKETTKNLLRICPLEIKGTGLEGTEKLKKMERHSSKA